MPVQRDHIDPCEVAGVKISPPGAEQEPDEGADPAENMNPVEPRHQKVDRKIDLCVGGFDLHRPLFDRCRLRVGQAGRPFGRLSKGQKGSVMMTLALGHSPELLLLDDPTLGLDVVARNAVFREVIGELADRGTTVFLTTHDLRAIEGLADHVAILHRGRVALSGGMEAVKAEWKRPLEDVFTAVTDEGAAAAPAEVRS